MKEDTSADAIVLEHVGIRMGETVILEDVCARVPSGGFTAIVGPNGAGKTSLTLAILGQLSHTGVIAFPRSGGHPRFGFVPQKLQFDREMPMTVTDYLLAGIQRVPLFFGRSKTLVGRIRDMLCELECEKLADRRFGALSGGEIQRVLMAQALLRDPEILVLDEPTSGVDVKGGKICCELLKKIRLNRGFTQLMVSHDLATVSAHATHVICLNHTVRAQGEPGKVLTHRVLTETFGLHLGIPDLHNLPANVQMCESSCPYHHAAHPGACSCGQHHVPPAEDEKNGGSGK